MRVMPLTDAMYLMMESREHPMHVGGLQLFELPAEADADYLSATYRRMVDTIDVSDVFRRTPYRSLGTLGAWSWASDQRIDLEYHVRFSALPRPGRFRELFELVSRLHGTLLDRRRPLWELHLIEGLEGNRFAIYTKVHHSVMDGVSALRWMQRSLSPDPDRRHMPPFFGLSQPEREGSPRRSADGAGGVGGALRSVLHAAALFGDVLGLLPAVFDLTTRGLSDHAAKLPFQAPKTLFNGTITGARRFAAQDWPMDRIAAVRDRTGCTVNDVVLAMCSGALRRYLLEMDALPDRGLVAAVPISLRADDLAGMAGNALGFTLCDLATEQVEPAQRLSAIRASMGRAKDSYAGRSPIQVLALSALTIAPLGLSPIPGFVDYAPPPFNLIISNVPGPGEPLYWNGARMDGVYPLSVVMDGQALNITVTSYAGCLRFGLTGCRRSVPHLQRLLLHLDESLAELEKVTVS